MNDKSLKNSKFGRSRELETADSAPTVNAESPHVSCKGEAGEDADLDNEHQLILQAFEGDFFEGRQAKPRFSPIRLCIKDIMSMEYVSKNPVDKYFSIYKFGKIHVDAVEFVGVVMSPGTRARYTSYDIADGTGTLSASWWGWSEAAVRGITKSVKSVAHFKSRVNTDRDPKAAWVCRNWAEPVLFDAVNKERQLPYGHVVWVRGRPVLSTKTLKLYIRIDESSIVEKDDDVARTSLVNETLYAYRHIYGQPCDLTDEKLKLLSVNTCALWNDDWNQYVTSSADIGPFEDGADCWPFLDKGEPID